MCWFPFLQSSCFLFSTSVCRCVDFLYYLCSKLVLYYHILICNVSTLTTKWHCFWCVCLCVFDCQVHMVMTRMKKWSLEQRGRGGKVKRRFFVSMSSQSSARILTPTGLFHAHVTAVACNIRSKSFCQKCRWQVTLTVRYACTLCMWFAWSDMMHCCMVYTECTEIAVVSHGTSHASAVSTPLWWIFKKALYKVILIHSCRIKCKCSKSAQEQRITQNKSN